MKTYINFNLKNKNLKKMGTALFSAILLIGSIAQARVLQANASEGTRPLHLNKPVKANNTPHYLSEGTKPFVMTAARYRDLMPFLDNVKVQLQKALGEAKGKGSKEQIDIYSKAMEKVVRLSVERGDGAFQNMFRSILNQGLQLCVKSTEKDGSVGPAVLAYSDNTGLKAQILKSHMLLAIKYFIDDMSMLERGHIILPYLQLGWDRLNLMYRYWPGVTDSTIAVKFVKTSIGHWIYTAQIERLDDSAQAQPLVEMYDTFVDLENNMYRLPNFQLDAKLRQLRFKVGVVMRDLSKSLKGMK